MMFNNLSFSSILDRVTILERPLDRAREFFQSGNSPIAGEPIYQSETSSADDITRETSSCDLDILDDADLIQERENEEGWVNPQEGTVQLIEDLFENIWHVDNNSVDLDRVENVLSLCPPMENLLGIEDKDHYNLLHKAIIFNSPPMMQVLLSHGCDVNLANQKSCGNGYHCPHANLGVLHLACYLGRKEMTEMILRWGADKNAKRKVSSSAALHCPAELQPDLLVSCQTSEKEEILSTCGAREPLFFAVLGDQVEVVKLFIRDDTSIKLIEELHLLHLACRIGAWQCLKYFISLNQHAINTFDTDGMPPMLLALKHGLKYVSLMLDNGCDVTLFNDLWEKGANVYHFIFSALPIGDEDHVTLCEILELIAQNKIVDINSKRESSGSSPLHELLHAINRVPRGNGRICDVRSTYLTSYDQSIIDAIEFLLAHGADVHSIDISGDTTLCNILSNKNHLARCALATNSEVPQKSKLCLKSSSFGIDNLIKVVGILVNNNVPYGLHSGGKSPISALLKTLCTYDNDSEENIIKSPFETMGEEGVMQKYTELLEILLEHCDPNASVEGELPPLFFLLSQATLSPDADDYMYIISLQHAKNLAKFAAILLENDAQTECELSDTDGEKIKYSCMDVLIYFLRKMQAYPHSRTADDLLSLKELLSVVFKYGGKAILYSAIFYHGPDISLSENDNIGSDQKSEPINTFLYQYLCFGAMNLQYVNDGGIYYDLLNLITNATTQTLLYRAFLSARLVFSCMHWPSTCDCGLCCEFHDMLEHHLEAPLSLKQICRLAVRDLISGFSPQRVEALKLPKAVNQYILLEEIL